MATSPPVCLPRVCLLHLAALKRSPCTPALHPAQDLFSPLNADWLLRVALGLGETEHAPLPAEGEVGRKGISHERTFRRGRQAAWLGRGRPGGCLLRARSSGVSPLQPCSRADARTPLRPCCLALCCARALSRCADLEAKLSELAGALAEDMAAEGLRGRTLTLKLKHASFEVGSGLAGGR